MKYSLARICHNLYYNRLVYSIIIVNFMLGVGFFVICMNFERTGSELLKESKRKSTEDVITVKQWNASIDDTNMDSYPISYDTYLKLSTDEKYANDLELLFTMSFIEHIFIFEPEQAIMANVYYMNENLFDYLYGFNRRTGVVYLGHAAYQGLRSAGEVVKSGEERNIAFIELGLYLDGDVLMADGKSYPYEVVMPIEENTIMNGFTHDTGYNMEEAIIFPIEEAVVPVSPYPEIQVNLRNTLFYRYLNEEWREDLIAQQLRELNTANKRVSFVVDNNYLELKRKLEDFSYDMDRWLFVAISMLFLSGIGCIGSMFLLLDKRHHFMAISIASGSTLWRIGVETVIEILIVLLLGGVFGILIAPVLRRFIIYQEELQFNIVGIGIVLITVIVFSVMSVVLGMRQLRVKDMVTTLKEE